MGTPNAADLSKESRYSLFTNINTKTFPGIIWHHVLWKMGALFFCKNAGFIFWKRRVSYDTGNNVVCCYRGLSPSIIVSYWTVLSECIPDFLHSDLGMFVVKNFFMSGVTILWKMFSVLLLRYFLRRGDDLLSTTISLHCRLLTKIFCNSCVMKTFPLSYDTNVFQKWGSLFYVKMEASFFKEIVSYDRWETFVLL